MITANDISISVYEPRQDSLNKRRRVELSLCLKPFIDIAEGVCAEMPEGRAREILVHMLWQKLYGDLERPLQEFIRLAQYSARMENISDLQEMGQAIMKLIEAPKESEVKDLPSPPLLPRLRWRVGPMTRDEFQYRYHSWVTPDKAEADAEAGLVNQCGVVDDTVLPVCFGTGLWALMLRSSYRFLCKTVPELVQKDVEAKR
jgi:hypothetical protein